MFNISGSELVFLIVAGLIILGPDRLPGVMSKAGRLYGELRRMANGYEKEFRDTFAEPMTEFRRAAEEVGKEIAGFGQVDTAPSPPMRPERAVASPSFDVKPRPEPEDGAGESDIR